MKSTIHNNAQYCAFILCFIRAHLLINEESHRITLWISMSTQQYCGNDRKYLHIASLIVGCSLPTIWLLGTHLFDYFILFFRPLQLFQAGYLDSSLPAFHLNQVFRLFLTQDTRNTINQFHLSKQEANFCNKDKPPKTPANTCSVMSQFSYKVSFLMWLKGVTISTTDESNGNMSLTLLLLPASKKQRLPGLFFPPPDGISLDPCSAEPWACSTGLGWCSLRNCSGFLSLVVQSCHRLQELKTSTSQSPCPPPIRACAPPDPPSSHDDGFAAPSTPLQVQRHTRARNCGEKLGFGLKKTQTKAKSTSLQGGLNTRVLHPPAQHNQFPLNSHLAEPRFPCKNEFLKSLEKLIHVHSPRKLKSKLK